MGMEKYELFVRLAGSTLIYEPGWSRDNKTGSWRSIKPVKDEKKCNGCDLCWLYCPEGCIERGSIVIDYAYCKGCGICAEECKRDAMHMVREDE